MTGGGGGLRQSALWDLFLRMRQTIPSLASTADTTRPSTLEGRVRMVALVRQGGGERADTLDGKTIPDSAAAALPGPLCRWKPHCDMKSGHRGCRLFGYRICCGAGSSCHAVEK